MLALWPFNYIISRCVVQDYYLWRRVPQFLIQLIEHLHTTDTDTTSQVRVGGQLSEPFETTSGVRHGCVLAPVFFCIAVDCILSSCTGIMAHFMGTTVGSSKFMDQDYADDAVLFFCALLSGRTSCQTSMKLHIRWVWIPPGRKPRSRT